MDKDNKNKNKLNIELSDEVAAGIYSNLAVINHSVSEFFIDFIQLMPNVPKAKVRSRIILSPEHSKRLLLALKNNIETYEKNYGKIKDINSSNNFPMNLGGPIPEA
tara:strand:+ start:531 stop:848 length:318 start_codon:yes stop_codon:yes gene_type:complete